MEETPYEMTPVRTCFSSKGSIIRCSVHLRSTVGLDGHPRTSRFSSFAKRQEPDRMSSSESTIRLRVSPPPATDARPTNVPSRRRRQARAGRRPASSDEARSARQPGSSTSTRGPTASGVRSRAEIPVPPVRSGTSVRGRAGAVRAARRTRAIVRHGRASTSCPARSAGARSHRRSDRRLTPRVSLTVTIAHRTDRGAPACACRRSDRA
jgi:hypothetical protein